MERRVTRYQQSDDAESFLWVIVWIITKTSAISGSGSAYPSVNTLDSLAIYKDNVISLLEPKGSLSGPMREMVASLKINGGKDLEELCLLHVQNRLNEFQVVVEEHCVFES
jgi:hypothetical protein